MNETEIFEGDTLLPEVFDPSMEEGSAFKPVPKDVYKAQIVDATVAVPSTQNGYGINLIWQIMEGDYDNRQVWQWITLTNSSTQATQIGRRQFKDLCVACGVSEQVTDVSIFKFVPCQIRVTIKPDQNGDDRNNVSRILHIDAQVKRPRQALKPAQPAKPSSPATAAPATSTGAATITTMAPAPPAAAQPAATAAPAPKPASNATAGANGNVPPWRQAKPSASEDLDDELPY